MKISDFQKEVHRNATEKGWWNKGDRNFGEICALFHSEISEAFEEHRKGKDMNQIYFNVISSKPEGISVELADCIIRILDFCEHHSINMESILRKKHLYNCQRSYRHGNKKA